MPDRGSSQANDLYVGQVFYSVLCEVIRCSQPGRLASSTHQCSLYSHETRHRTTEQQVILINIYFKWNIRITANTSMVLAEIVTCVKASGQSWDCRNNFLKMETTTSWTALLQHVSPVCKQTLEQLGLELEMGVTNDYLYKILRSYPV